MKLMCLQARWGELGTVYSFGRGLYGYSQPAYSTVLFSAPMGPAAVKTARVAAAQDTTVFAGSLQVLFSSSLDF